MDYSGLCLCCPSNFEGMEEQGLTYEEDADYLSFPREAKDYLPTFINTKEKWMETVLQSNCIHMSRTKCRLHVVAATCSTSVMLLPRCTRAPTKRHSSLVEAVLTGSEVTLPGLVEIPRSPWGTQHY